MSNKLVPPCAIVVVGLIWSLSLAGCGKQTKDAPVAVGQVIAHVGTDDITAQELENEFRLDNVPPDKRSDALVKRVLGEIVARKYLVQQALAAKLDREPAVHLDIMRSREQVLSNAVVQRNVEFQVRVDRKVRCQSVYWRSPLSVRQARTIKHRADKFRGRCGHSGRRRRYQNLQNVGSGGSEADGNGYFTHALAWQFGQRKHVGGIPRCAEEQE